MDEGRYINDDMIRFMERRSAERDRMAMEKDARLRELAEAQAQARKREAWKESRALSLGRVLMCGAAVFVLAGTAGALADPGALLRDTGFFLSGAYLLGSVLRLAHEMGC